VIAKLLLCITGLWTDTLGNFGYEDYVRLIGLQLKLQRSIHTHQADAADPVDG
jgi:hypothetical protein